MIFTSLKQMGIKVICYSYNWLGKREQLTTKSTARNIWRSVCSMKGPKFVPCKGWRRQGAPDHLHLQGWRLAHIGEGELKQEQEQDKKRSRSRSSSRSRRTRTIRSRCRSRTRQLLPGGGRCSEQDHP